jgi:hypothetical protein
MPEALRPVVRGEGEVRRNQAHTGALRRTQAHSGAIRLAACLRPIVIGRNQAQSGAHACGP